MKSDNLIARAVNRYVLLKANIKDQTKQVNQIRNEFLNDFIATEKEQQTYTSKTNAIQFKNINKQKIDYTSLIKELKEKGFDNLIQKHTTQVSEPRLTITEI